MSNKAIEEYLKEKQARESAERAKRDAEIARIAAENDKRRKVEEAERQKAIDAEDRRREAAYEKELDAEARQYFQEGNPGASDAVWKSVRDEFRKLVMRRRAEAAAGQSHSLYQWR